MVIREQFVVLLRNTTAVAITKLGFVSFGVWLSEIVAERGGGQKPPLLFSLRLGCDLRSEIVA